MCHLRARGVEARLRKSIARHVVIIDDSGPDHAVGVWFPDLPGCTSAGDDIVLALRNAPEVLELYAEGLQEDGQKLPRPRTLTELKADPEIAEGLKAYMVALIELPARAYAAE
jgi:predicted RNase H-like HicB family nuclease